MEILKGYQTAKDIRREARRAMRRCPDLLPALCVIQAGEEDIAGLYLESLRKCFAKVEVGIRNVKLPASTDRETFLAAVRAANESSADGVLVLKPFPAGLTGREIGALLDPEKDVDGLAFYLGEEKRVHFPCTAEGIFRLLEARKLPAEGAKVCVVGRSDTVGKPVAEEMIRRGFSVTLYGSDAPDLSEGLREADIVVSAVGCPGLFGADMLKEGAAVFDAGLTRGEDGKMRGDCDPAGAEKLSLLTPPVGGIGSVTASVMALHVVKSALKRREDTAQVSVHEAPGTETVKIRYLSGAVEHLRYIGGISDWIDLRCAEETEIRAGEMKLVPLGVAMKLPAGYEAHVVARSSSFKNFGILQANAFGIIDESYSGNGDQWYFPAYAVRDTLLRVNDRICQFRIERHQPTVVFEETEELGEGGRGGFGSTGRN